MKLTGKEAIQYAEANDLLLSKYTDPTEAARENVTVEDARKIASEDPNLIYLDLPDDKITVRVLGGPKYTADTYDEAIMRLPEKHNLAQIYMPGTYLTPLPATQALGKIKLSPSARPVDCAGIPMRGLTAQVGDIIEVKWMNGVRHNSGGGIFYVIERRSMRISAITSIAVGHGGAECEDGRDFALTGDANFAILEQPE